MLTEQMSALKAERREHERELAELQRKQRKSHNYYQKRREKASSTPVRTPTPTSGSTLTTPSQDHWRFLHLLPPVEPHGHRGQVSQNFLSFSLPPKSKQLSTAVILLSLHQTKKALLHQDTLVSIFGKASPCTEEAN